MSKLPAALSSPEDKRRFVRALFSTIADRYDLITVALSYGRDRSWKRRLIQRATLSPGERVLDLACGTGDIAFEAARHGARVVGLDVTARMIELARLKVPTAVGDGCVQAPRFVVGDMMALPFASHSVQVVTTGYGLRNVPQLTPAVVEIARVLTPGGRLLSLDFNRPRRAWVRWPYLAYLTMVGAALGWLLHRDPDTYRYIPESIKRYPGADGVAALLREHGFEEVRVEPVLGGLMALHIARRRHDASVP